MSNPANTPTIPTVVPITKYRRHLQTLSQVLDYELARAVPFDVCLIAAGRPVHKGYRRTQYRGRKFYLHRAIVERAIGRHLAEGEQTRHLCHRPMCINPSHLTFGDSFENAADKTTAGRTACGEQLRRNIADRG